MARHASPLETLLISETFDGEVAFNEPLSRHTTYRIGGPASYFVQAHSLNALRRTIECAQQTGLAWTVLGKGSNVLASDDGFAGAVITLGRDFRSCSYDAEAKRIIAGAGAALSSVVQLALRNSLAGMEFAVGTPGTVGGALRMNAGTRNDWISGQLANVTTFSARKGLVFYRASDLEWGYRKSSFEPDEVILECELAVEPADEFYIRAKMEASLRKRKESQPLAEPTCGSVFKNPEGASVARLIEESGLKGACLGQAVVSDKHANFIVNAGGATAADVVGLMDTIQTKVFRDHGIKLQPEVQFLGFA